MIYKDPIFKEFCTERNLMKGTQKGYYKALRLYLQLHNITLKQMIEQADDEEEQGIRAKKRTITKRLKTFRTYLITEGYSVSVVKDYFGKIKSFYRHFEIEIPYLPKVQLKKTHHERYEDIPTIKHIKEAIESTNNLKYKAIILFMSSSGTARNETANLTINDFIKATKEYHNNINLNKTLSELENKKNVIPLFEMVRIKTNYPYYTCCSPETVKYILKYLKTRKRLKKTDRLFQIDPPGITKAFQRINDKNNWGMVNHYGFFHSHGLRKFNATVIEDIGFANTLQGRKADNITETYFKHNPKRIKEKYLEHLPKLTINKTVVNTVDSEATKELREELKAKDDIINNMNQRLTRLEEADNRPIK